MTDKEWIVVYVNELPKECSKCPLRCGNSCNLLKETDYENMIGGNCRLYHCPLKTIQSVQNQKAVEVLEKVKQSIADITAEIIYQDCRWLGKQAIYDKIDQLISELKGEVENE